MGFGAGEVGVVEGFEVDGGGLDGFEVLGVGVVEELEDVPAEGFEGVGVDAEHGAEAIMTNGKAL